MSEAQYTQYTNLHLFAEKWRGYKINSPVLGEEEFRNKMQVDAYVELKYINVNTGKPVRIYLLSRTSTYSDKSQELKKLLARIKTPSDVILVSKGKFKSHAMRAISTYKHLRVETYKHEHFALEIPRGPLCYQHRIMSRDEVKTLLNDDLSCYLTNLPKILDDDPQCIWIGAEVGDVIEIKSYSDISGECIQYRVVIAHTGRIVSFRKPKNNDDADDNISVTTETPNVDINDEGSDDEEIKEIREAAQADDYDDDDDDDE